MMDNQIVVINYIFLYIRFSVHPITLIGKKNSYSKDFSFSRKNMIIEIRLLNLFFKEIDNNTIVLFSFLF